MKLAKIMTMQLIALAMTMAASADIPDQMSMEDVHGVVETSIKLVEDIYPLEDMAKKIGTELRARLAAGVFDTSDPQVLVQALDVALGDISGDLHMSFTADPKQYDVLMTTPADGGDIDDDASPEQIAYNLRAARQVNFGFSDARFLAGNIGYLNITGFWDGGEEAVDKTEAAMRFLSGSDAVIIDVRANGGGSADAVRLVQSWFFDEPTHVLTFHNRSEGIAEKSMTAPRPEKYFLGDVPLYVLTSGRTGSAAEDFAYIMQAHEKATLIGATTAGAGHTVGFYPVAPGFVIGISNGRPESPITGTGWEGVGVKPDIEVPIADALRTAQIEALTILKANAGEEGSGPYDWALTGLEGQANPPSFSKRELKAMTGSFGPRAISREGSKLYYSRSGGAKAELIPLTKTVFQHPLSSGFRIRFVWEGKKVIAIEGLFLNGRVDPNPRD